MTTRHEVVIIGGGASGVLLTAQLSRSAGGSVALVEAGPEFATGVAYATEDPSHVLNTRACVMSAWPDDPSHFVEWTRRHIDSTAGPDSFLQRRTYRRYLSAVLGAARSRGSRVVSTVHGRAVAVHLRHPDEPSAEVVLADGRRLRANRVVLAIGHAAPADPAVIDERVRFDRRYVADPWRSAAQRRPTDRPVLVIGTGLTAVDVILTLVGTGYRGRIDAISRRGLWPTAHNDAPLPTTPPAIDTRSARALIRSVRRAVRDCSDVDGNVPSVADTPGWREVIDGLRHEANPAWSRLSAAERDRLARHAGRLWDIHRHRMAPDVARRMQHLRSTDTVDVLAGGVAGLVPAYDGIAATLDLATGIEQRTYGLVVNCTGPRTVLPTRDARLTPRGRSHPPRAARHGTGDDARRRPRRR